MEKDYKGTLTLNPAFWRIALLLLGILIYTMVTQPMVLNAAKYAQVSREILKNGDWINLTIGGEGYEQKPPLLFWLGALAFALSGVSDVVWKLAVLGASLLGIYSTYRLGKLLYGELAGRLAAFFWVCSLGFLHFHSDIHTDTLLADTVLFSTWQLAAFFNNHKKSHFFLGIIGAGLSMLAKGPVGLAIPVFAIGSHLLFRRQWKEIFHPRWLLAMLIIALMVIPALWGLYNQFGTEGIRFYFWTNNMGRITGSYYGSNNDYFFYLHTVAYLMAPFTAFGLVGLGCKLAALFRRSPAGSGPAENEYYTTGALIPFLIVLSVAKTKNPHYLLPLLPFFMILGARFVQTYSSGETVRMLRRTVFGFNIALVILIWILTLLFALYLFPERNLWYWTVLLFSGLLMFYGGRYYHGISRQIALLTFTLFAFLFSLNFSIYPALSTYHSPFLAIETLRERALPGEEIHLYGHSSRNWEIFFYSANPGRYFSGKEQLPALLHEKGDWVFTDERGREEITAALPGVVNVEEYKHNSLGKIRLPFLLPATREAKLETRVLLKLP